MTQAVIDRLSAVLKTSKGRRNVFMKVGDSITISNHFLKCFVQDTVELGDYQHLASTLAFFRQVPLGAPKNSFDRASLATSVGWTARDPRLRSPSPLDKEIKGTRPAFAVIMFGSNGSSLTGVSTFERDLLADIDLLLDRGIIPLMSTIPPKLHKPESMAALPEMNAIVRVIAQARQVPLMDYNLALQQLRDFGLSDDGVHPRPYLANYVAHGCWLTAVALEAGMNVRNLLALTALDRMRRFVLNGEAPEADLPTLEGEGTDNCPYGVDKLPFVDAAETGNAKEAAPQASETSKAGDAQHGVAYAIRLATPATLRVRLFADPHARLRVCWMNDHSSSQCRDDDSPMQLSASVGTHRLVVAPSAMSPPATSASYRLTVVPVE